MIVLGLDPGLANTGWGVIEYKDNHYRYIAHGVVKTSSSLSNATRLHQIFTQIQDVLTSYAPSMAGIETLYFAKNRTSALDVAQARGVLLLLLEQRGIKISELTPNQIKQSVSGSGSASKDGVAKMVQILLGAKMGAMPDHCSDALAAAIAATMNPINIRTINV